MTNRWENLQRWFEEVASAQRPVTLEATLKIYINGATGGVRVELLEMEEVEQRSKPELVKETG
jgi:hypothetical protein